jgi:hypothetical protein
MPLSVSLVELMVESANYLADWQLSRANANSASSIRAGDDLALFVGS